VRFATIRCSIATCAKPVGLRQMPKLRFNLRDLLWLTTLIAVGCKWPTLLIILLPLFVVAVLSRSGIGSLAPFVAIVVISPILGMLFSLYYWRYPFSQPPLLAEPRNIGIVEQLSHVNCLNPLRYTAATIGAVTGAVSGLPVGWNTSTEVYATDRIIQELASRNTTIQSQQPVSADIVTSFWYAANRAGLLVNGESGYPETKRLNGYIGIARRADGSRIAFATLLGNEQSNDHYPYYEFIAPLDQEDFGITQSQWFYIDIAGLEGANWLGFTKISFLLLAPITIVMQIVWFAWRSFRRLR